MADVESKGSATTGSLARRCQHQDATTSTCRTSRYWRWLAITCEPRPVAVPVPLAPARMARCMHRYSAGRPVDSGMAMPRHSTAYRRHLSPTPTPTAGTYCQRLSLADAGSPSLPSLFSLRSRSVRPLEMPENAECSSLCVALSTNIRSACATQEIGEGPTAVQARLCAGQWKIRQRIKNELSIAICQ